jgi:hypothetical protein
MYAKISVFMHIKNKCFLYVHKELVFLCIQNITVFLYTKKKKVFLCIQRISVFYVHKELILFYVRLFIVSAIFINIYFYLRTFLLL